MRRSDESLVAAAIDRCREIVKQQFITSGSVPGNILYNEKLEKRGLPSNLDKKIGFSGPTHGNNGGGTGTNTVNQPVASDRSRETGKSPSDAITSASTNSLHHEKPEMRGIGNQHDYTSTVSGQHQGESGMENGTSTSAGSMVSHTNTSTDRGIASTTRSGKSQHASKQSIRAQTSSRSSNLKVVNTLDQVQEYFLSDDMLKEIQQKCGSEIFGRVIKLQSWAAKTDAEVEELEVCCTYITLIL